MAEDYYEVLGLSRSATPEEIQKAYRRLARKHHPDLAEDKEAAKAQFQKIQHAYDVLSDPKKRKLYDQLGPAFEQGGQPYQGGEMPDGVDLEQIFGKGQVPEGGMEELLKQIFGAGAGGFSGRGFRGQGFPGGGFRQGGFQPGGFGGGAQTQTRAPVKGMDVEQRMTIPFGTSVLGGKHQLSLQRSDGSIENITVTIPPGISSGKKIRLRGQGRASPEGGPPGDLLVKVDVAKHPVFTRSGNNLHLDLPITIPEAILGAKIDLPTPHGEVTVTIPAGSSSGKLLRLKGMGVKKSSGQNGDLLVELKIVVPSDLSESDGEKLKSLAQEIRQKNPRTKIKW